MITNSNSDITTTTTTSTNNNNNNININNDNNNNNNSTAITIDTRQMQSELERRQQELEIKAAELAAREEALRQGGEFRRQHNWPPLPSFCPIKPCFFQDINVDIRPEFQRTVQWGYHIWIAFAIVELLNLFATIILSRKNTNFEIAFGIYSPIFFIPLSYVSWFRPLYKAFKNDSSFNFMIFFFMFFMQIALVGIFALGLSGAVGLLTVLSNLNHGIIVSIVLVITGGAWIGYVAACVLYLLKVHSIYRSSGASISKARNEFTQGVISNRYVQQTVATAARETVNHATGVR